MCVFFFFNDTATTEIYTLSLHDALPISEQQTRIIEEAAHSVAEDNVELAQCFIVKSACEKDRKEHTSELQSLTNLVCRLLLEKKKKIKKKKKKNTTTQTQ